MEIKKNAVDLTDLAIGIIILGIVVSIGANVLINLRDNRLTELSTVSNQQNITTNINTAPSTDLSATWFKGVTAVINTTSGQTITSGNYSTAVDGLGVGTFTLTDAQFNNTLVQVTYDTYNTSSRSDYELANDAATGLAEYGNWFDIIVIVGVAAVILSLIFLAFSRRDGGSGFNQAY